MNNEIKNNEIKNNEIKNNEIKKILVVGCGMEKKSNTKTTIYTNVDQNPLVSPDVIMDVDIFPWPFDDNFYDKIIAKDIYEHVLFPIKFLNECWRVLKQHCNIYIRTSCWNTKQSYTDPTHRRFCTLESFDYFDPSTFFGSKYKFYSRFKWQILEKKKSGQELIFVLKKGLKNEV